MQPKISVIVPIYNVEDYLPRCLDSILTQTYENIQLILIDDGSVDGSGAICDAYAAKDGRVQVIHQENAGIGRTRNVGLSLCQGEYITFVDSDDYLFPDALERLYGRMQADGSDMLIANCIRLYEDGSCGGPCHTYPAEAMDRTAFLRCMTDIDAVPVCPWGKLYSKACMEGIAYPAVRVGEDMMTFPAVVERCQRISMENEPVYYYFQRGNSLMRGQNQQTKTEHCRAVIHMARFLWDNGCYDGAATWYSTAVKNALTIRSGRVTLFRSRFDRQARRTLYRRLDRKGKLAWLCLHLPLCDRLFSKVFSK